MDFTERFVYRRNDKKGIHCYDGTPCATKEVFDSIGEAGIKHIQKMIIEMIEMRKKMFGYGKAEYYGFSDSEAFFDMETSTMIQLLANAKERLEKMTGYNLQFPDQITENAFLMILRHPFGSYKKKLGKKAFRSRVNDWQGGVFSMKNLRDEKDEAESAVKWLKTEYPQLLKKIISEK